MKNSSIDLSKNSFIHKLEFNNFMKLFSLWFNYNDAIEYFDINFDFENGAK